MRPFRFGVNVRTAASRSAWADKARKVESLGFSTLLIPDHLTDLMPPLLSLVSAAEATSTLRLGTFVLNNDFRHPVLVAREAAALDLLSDGRLELGLGAGHMQAECYQVGIPFDRAPVRIARLAEAVQVIKTLLAGGTASLGGRHYTIREHQGFPPPVQRPRPPILIGGNGPKLLSVAAREADVVGLTGLGFPRGGSAVDVAGFKAASVDERVAWVRAEAGPRFAELELNALIQRVIPTDDARGTAAELATHFPALTVDDVLESPYLLIGTVDEMVAALQARRVRWGISYWVTHEPFLDQFAPVVARLNGL
ncbi:MAG: TIGR03621 family F420-dependent LLM class oxidoreductase [Chloroflexi bacterium]|nr:TIGR03621 family F420-dependent LLM class oxidoreductase [Chloroflexota bacterium]